MEDNFAQLVKTLAAEPKYTPNEEDLTVVAITATLDDLRARNTAVTDALTALSNARVARDKAFYGAATGLTTIAKAIKGYVRSRFGSLSLEFKQVKGLRFTRFKRG